MSYKRKEPSFFSLNFHLGSMLLKEDSRKHSSHSKVHMFRQFRTIIMIVALKMGLAHIISGLLGNLMQKSKFLVFLKN
jgi:vacuolar-type H+-ATPase subunit I/STV1